MFRYLQLLLLCLDMKKESIFNYKVDLKQIMIHNSLQCKLVGVYFLQNENLFDSYIMGFERFNKIFNAKLIKIIKHLCY